MMSSQRGTWNLFQIPKMVSDLLTRIKPRQSVNYTWALKHWDIAEITWRLDCERYYAGSWMEMTEIDLWIASLNSSYFHVFL